MSELVVKILGIGCPRCHALENELRLIIERENIAARVERVADLDEIMKYRPLAMPGLVIQEQLVCAGRVPSRTELISLLRSGGRK